MDGTFNPGAALAATHYVTHKLGKAKPPTYLVVLKVLYFADKYHLQHYGRLIANSTYSAQKDGPVASEIYALLRQNERMSDLPGIIFVKGFAPALKADGEPNLDELSESDTEALDWAIKNYGHKSAKQLSNESHDKAWRAAHTRWEATRADSDATMLFSEIVATLPNKKSLIKYLADPYPD